MNVSAIKVELSSRAIVITSFHFSQAEDLDRTSKDSIQLSKSLRLQQRGPIRLQLRLST